MKYGFIGCGNMGGALARALSQVTKDICLCDRSGRGRALAQELGIQYADARTVAAQCDRIFLGVKPHMITDALAPLYDILRERKPTLITMAAGVEMQQLCSLLDCPMPVIRIMPNTPVCIGCGTVLYCANVFVEEQIYADVLADLQPAGVVTYLPEQLMDAGSALSGSGPAYCYVFLEALADGAVACGIPRQQAYIMAANTMIGAAQMLLSSGQHPGALKDAVCSPGGSTIAGLKALEDRAFRGAVMECVQATCRRNGVLGK